MKPYTHIRLQASADCADGVGEARKSSAVNVPGKGGDIHNSTRNATAKRKTRRSMKRADKAKTWREIQNDLNS